MSIEERAKEIAIKLVTKMYDNTLDSAKQCAIIACDLKIEGEYRWEGNYILYNLVKKEIEQLNEI
jgi:hypothetical protein